LAFSNADAANPAEIPVRLSQALFVTVVFISDDILANVESISPSKLFNWVDNPLFNVDISEETNTLYTNYMNNREQNASDIYSNVFEDMYILGYNVNKHLTPINQALKQNLKTYLGEYRMMTDAVNIIDGFIVNIGVDFEVICYSNYNKREVLTNCLTNIQNYFNIDNWTFNKPINISEMELILANVEGVMSVPSVKISNLCGGDGNYSPNRYNIDEATQGKMVYPSLDPCIFEVKYPNKDIKGRAL
jgi:hypothetical protein